MPRPGFYRPLPWQPHATPPQKKHLTPPPNRGKTGFMSTNLEVITNEKLDALLAASPAERVTKEYIESRILSREFIRIGSTVTLCNLTLDNAFRQLWSPFGFLLSEKNKLKAGDAKAA